jgi:RHS repeat-associated protein
VALVRFSSCISYYDNPSSNPLIHTRARRQQGASLSSKETTPSRPDRVVGHRRRPWPTWWPTRRRLDTAAFDFIEGFHNAGDVGGTASWAITNAHGDVVGTTVSSGAFTANPADDEFGAGQAPGSRLGWLGGKERFKTGGALGLIRMGVRLYDPNLGRFLEVDLVEGGSANDYDYCSADPINCIDLAGTWGWRNLRRWSKKWLTAKNHCGSSHRRPCIHHRDDGCGC